MGHVHQKVHLRGEKAATVRMLVDTDETFSVILPRLARALGIKHPRRSEALQLPMEDAFDWEPIWQWSRSTGARLQLRSLLEPSASLFWASKHGSVGSIRRSCQKTSLPVTAFTPSAWVVTTDLRYSGAGRNNRQFLTALNAVLSQIGTQKNKMDTQLFFGWLPRASEKQGMSRLKTLHFRVCAGTG